MAPITAEVPEIHVKSYSSQDPDGTALVDMEDIGWVSARKWRMKKGYPVTRVYAGKRNGKSRCRDVVMHRFILGLERGDPREVDHINRNRLDNRRCNLRVVSQEENAQNQGAHRRWGKSGISSAHRGVAWDRANGKWKAQVRHQGRCHALGYYENEGAAAEAARAWRKENLPYTVEEGDMPL